MAGSLLALAERMESLATAVQEGFAAPASDTAWAILNNLAVNTPVDTSRALSNWQVSLDRPFVYDIGAYSPGHHGSTESVSREQMLATARYLLSHRRPGQRIFISNNVPYIRRLNDGHSRQAAAGFIERAVAVGNRVARNARILSQAQSGRYKPRKFRGDNPT